MRESLVAELLGPDGAQDDPNLFEYFVEAQNRFDKPLIVGRWGTGKTSLLLWRSKALMSVLADQELGQKRPWYVEEKDLNIVEITKAFEEHEGSTTRRYSIFAQMWKSEIHLRAIQILVSLKSVYSDQLVSDSWDVLSRKQLHKKLPDGVWRNATLLLGLLSRARTH